MNTNFNKAIERLIELSAEGGMTVTYTNNTVSLNLKADDKFDLIARDDGTTCLYYVTEINATPVEISFKESDLASVEWYKYGEFEECTCIELIRFTFVDGGVMDCYEDLR